MSSDDQALQKYTLDARMYGPSFPEHASQRKDPIESREDEDTDGLTVEKSDQGYIILCRPPKSLAKLMAVSNGLPSEDLHVTLFLLDAGPEPEDVLTLLEKYPRPIKARFTGQIAKFDRRIYGTGDPYVMLINSPELMATYTSMREQLDSAGMTYATNYEYNPHMTLGYFEETPLVLAMGVSTFYLSEPQMDVMWNLPLLKEGGGAGGGAGDGGGPGVATSGDAGFFTPTFGGSKTKKRAALKMWMGISASGAQNQGHDPKTTKKPTGKDPAHFPKDTTLGDARRTDMHVTNKAFDTLYSNIGGLDNMRGEHAKTIDPSDAQVSQEKDKKRKPDEALQLLFDWIDKAVGAKAAPKAPTAGAPNQQTKTSPTQQTTPAGGPKGVAQSNPSGRPPKGQEDLVPQSGDWYHPVRWVRPDEVSAEQQRAAGEEEKKPTARPKGTPKPTTTPPGQPTPVVSEATKVALGEFGELSFGGKSHNKTYEEIEIDGKRYHDGPSHELQAVRQQIRDFFSQMFGSDADKFYDKVANFIDGDVDLAEELGSDLLSNSKIMRAAQEISQAVFGDKPRELFRGFDDESGEVSKQGTGDINLPVRSLSSWTSDQSIADGFAGYAENPILVSRKAETHEVGLIPSLFAGKEADHVMAAAYEHQNEIMLVSSSGTTSSKIMKAMDGGNNETAFEEFLHAAHNVEDEFQIEKQMPNNPELVPQTGDPQHPGHWVLPDTAKTGKAEGASHADLPAFTKDMAKWEKGQPLKNLPSKMTLPSLQMAGHSLADKKSPVSSLLRYLREVASHMSDDEKKQIGQLLNKAKAKKALPKEDFLTISGIVNPYVMEYNGSLADEEEEAAGEVEAPAEAGMAPQAPVPPPPPPPTDFKGTEIPFVEGGHSHPLMNLLQSIQGFKDSITKPEIKTYVESVTKYVNSKGIEVLSPKQAEALVNIWTYNEKHGQQKA